MFRVGWNLVSTVAEVDLNPGMADEQVGREPVCIAAVVRKVGDVLDEIPAPHATKRAALESLLSEIDDKATANEPTFSRKFDPTDPEKSPQRPTS